MTTTKRIKGQTVLAAIDKLSATQLLMLAEAIKEQPPQDGESLAAHLTDFESSAKSALRQCFGVVNGQIHE